jgi:hypothetical protein
MRFKREKIFLCYKYSAIAGQQKWNLANCMSKINPSSSKEAMCQIRKKIWIMQNSDISFVQNGSIGYHTWFSFFKKK